MHRFHIALGVVNIEASVRDYSARLRCAPVVVVPGEYALWRTEALNFSIRKAEEREAGLLRHLGWEDATAAAFTLDTDVNGVVWERFASQQQKAEIESLWPDADYRTHASSEHSTSLEQLRASIDGVDRQIVALLAQRGAHLKDAAKLKAEATAAKAPDRVEQVIANVSALAEELDANPAVVERVYRAMIEAFISMELEKHATIRQPATPPPQR